MQLNKPNKHQLEEEILPTTSNPESGLNLLLRDLEAKEREQKKLAYKLKVTPAAILISKGEFYAKRYHLRRDLLALVMLD